VKVLEKEMTELRKELKKDGLECRKEGIAYRKDIDHLKSSIAAAMRYRQLIEKKRCDIWRDYGTMFTEAHPDSVAESSRS
jgi:hypothetical protein